MHPARRRAQPEGALDGLRVRPDATGARLTIAPAESAQQAFD